MYADYLGQRVAAGEHRKPLLHELSKDLGEILDVSPNTAKRLIEAPDKPPGRRRKFNSR
jgi:hypothetical protein